MQTCWMLVLSCVKFQFVWQFWWYEKCLNWSCSRAHHVVYYYLILDWSWSQHRHSLLSFIILCVVHFLASSIRGFRLFANAVGATYLLLLTAPLRGLTRIVPYSNSLFFLCLHRVVGCPWPWRPQVPYLNSNNNIEERNNYIHRIHIERESWPHGGQEQQRVYWATPIPF